MKNQTINGHLNDNQYPILKTKLYIPSPGPSYVSRKRLVKRLNSGFQGKFSLISAPAGFGKTTLLSEWIDQGEFPVGWLSINNDDNDLTRFSIYFIHALENIHPDIGKTALDMLQSPKIPAIEPILTNIINDIIPFDKQFALILDDYHLINSDEIHNMLTFLIDHLPQQMHLVIATRSDPLLPLARLRSQNQLTEIRASDLTFTLNETVKFFNEILKLKLSFEDIQLLESRTEGWITGLQLIALSLKGKKNISEFIQDFSADNRYIVDYLMEEVIHNQPEHIQNFLLRTSILERLNGSLCDAVTTNTNSDQMLKLLERMNLFIFPSDIERSWYRYHHLFANLLQQRLELNYDEQMINTLNQKASLWFEQNKLLNEAIEYALRGNDFQRAILLIEGLSESMMMRSEITTIKKWIEALPETLLLQNPLLCVYHSMTLLLTGQPFTSALSRVRHAIEADSCCKYEGDIKAFQALIAVYQGKVKESIELSQQALDMLPEDRLFFRSLIAGFLGLNYLFNGNIEAAKPTFKEALNIGLKTGNRMITVLAQCHQAEICIIEGRLYDAKTIYEKAYNSALSSQEKPQPIGGMALIGLGNLYEEWNQLSKAKELYLEGIELADKWGEIGSLNGYLGLSQVYKIQGNMKKAQAFLDKAKQVAVNFDVMETDDFIVANYQARLWILQKNYTALENWRHERKFDVENEIMKYKNIDHYPEISFLRVYEYITYARVWLSQERFEQTSDLLLCLHQIAQKANWDAFKAEICMLQALVHKSLGNLNSALHELKKSLTIAETGGFIRLYCNEGKSISDLLKKIVHESGHKHPGQDAQRPSNKYLNKILHAIKTEQETNYNPEALSEREFDVLHQLASGLSNQEIARKLFISLNTVKSHVKNINSKLNVHSRTQIIAKAKELGLLE